MGKTEASVEELVGMIERGELRLSVATCGALRAFATCSIPFIAASPPEADEIANLAFIGGKTNCRILDTRPAQYLAKTGEAAFAAQCIPTASQLVELGSYRKFLVERRKTIAARLKAFLGTHLSGTSS
jgi:hypothetical protein